MSIIANDLNSSSLIQCNYNMAVSVVGPLEDWEAKNLAATPTYFGLKCFEIATKQTTTERTMKWLLLGTEIGDSDSTMTYATFLSGLNPDLIYKGDEAALWCNQTKLYDHSWLTVSYFDPSRSRVRRHLTRLLLSGSLSKNQDSVLYRSFFRSNLREVHLLPLISKYLKKELRVGRDCAYVRVDLSITSLFDIASVVSRDVSSVISLKLFLESDNQFLCFLPLLFSHLLNLKDVSFRSCGDGTPKLDLSFLHHVDTSKLNSLELSSCIFDSLSPLSLCDLSSLHTLTISWFPEVDGLHPLNGLSSDITRSLKYIFVSDSHLEDLSPLSDCDLSSLEELTFSHNTSLSDLSALRGSDLSSLTSFRCDSTNISDLSPLCECKGLALEELLLSGTLVADLSPLSLLDLSHLKWPVALQFTNVSDLSPLENISYDGVEVNISGTPAGEKMEEEGLESPQTIGRVEVVWDT